MSGQLQHSRESGFREREMRLQRKEPAPSRGPPALALAPTSLLTRGGRTPPRWKVSGAIRNTPAWRNPRRSRKELIPHHAHTGGGLLVRNAQSGCMKPFHRLISVPDPFLETGKRHCTGSCHAPPCDPLQCCTPHKGQTYPEAVTGASFHSCNQYGRQLTHPAGGG